MSKTTNPWRQTKQRRLEPLRARLKCECTVYKETVSAELGGSALEYCECKPPGIETGPEVVEVLSVSPRRIDHDALKLFLRGPEWRVHEAFTLISGAALLREKRVPLVICERDLFPGSWKEMLAEITVLRKPPYLIVTSHLADEYLWAEALNLGARDVLSKPFESAEVARVLCSAWLHWRLQYGAAAEPLKSCDSARGLEPACRRIIRRLAAKEEMCK